MLMIQIERRDRVEVERGRAKRKKRKNRKECEAMALPSRNRFGAHRIGGDRGRVTQRFGQDLQMELPVQPQSRR
jgi:hypothetical protein